MFWLRALLLSTIPCVQCLLKKISVDVYLPFAKYTTLSYLTVRSFHVLCASVHFSRAQLHPSLIHVLPTFLTSSLTCLSSLPCLLSPPTPIPPPSHSFQRAELPECDRVHSETLRQEYNDAVKTRDFHFDEEVLEYLRGFLRDNDRKIESAKRRLAQSEDSPEMEAKVRKRQSAHVGVA